MRDYSVTIRTLGTAGDKYQRTLDSIARQTIQPKQVFVVLPKGYAPPKERLGRETFIYSDKGMVSQRVAGFQACASEFILALDDDVDFDSDFVARMFATMEKANSDFVSPIVKECESGGVKRSSFVKRMKDWCLGVSCSRSLQEPFMVKIWRTGGFIVNTNILPNVQYYNQSGHGTCLFGKTAAVKRMRFEDELWLQDCRYALPEDMVMFYKLYLLGNKIAMNTEVRFVHLDAGASLMSSDKKLNNIYASARNGFIFWHRFVYKQSKTLSDKSVSLACFFRRVVFTTFFAFLKGLLKGGNLINVKTYIKGYGDGLRYICSDNYKYMNQLPPPIGKESKLRKIYSFGLYHGMAYVMFVLSLRLFKEDNRIRVFFRNMHDTAVKRYASYTCRDVVDKYHNRQQTDDPLAPDCPIWIFWWQGEDNMPPLVKSCLRSVRMHAESHPVKVVTQYNINKYLDIPQHITERLEENAGGMMRGMSFIHFSDYVRMALLYEHGGIWLDATCFLSAPLAIPQNALFVSTRTKILEKVPNKGKWNIYYLGAAKHNVLFGYMKDMLSGYWKKNDFVIDYFFTDYCISLAYDSYPYIRKMIDELPALSSDYDPHSIYFLLNRPYDQDRALAICSEVNLHKLTWKGVQNEYTENNELTFYGWILRN